MTLRKSFLKLIANKDESKPLGQDQQEIHRRSRNHVGDCEEVSRDELH